ncbi:FAD-dependent oxidoreductase [Streptomyces yanii]|uniref:FAD-dependent oxidoreductase n=1 Tax=Streptomyces yanii TaxID=78510 RepID=UPI0031E91C5C
MRQGAHRAAARPDHAPAAVGREALSVAPGLVDATRVETRIGIRSMGPDVRPLLGAVPHVTGLIVVNGLGASGLTIGPYAGSVAARLARQADPGIDLAGGWGRVTATVPQQLWSPGGFTAVGWQQLWLWPAAIIPRAQTNRRTTSECSPPRESPTHAVARDCPA